MKLFSKSLLNRLSVGPVLCLILLFSGPAIIPAVSGQVAQMEKAQKILPNTLEAIEDTLGALGFIMINDTSSNNRFGACRKFIPLLAKGLKIPGSFSYPFSQLQQVSILYPPDSSFRVFSWQLYVDENTYHYYGAIQMNTPGQELYPLIDRSADIPYPEQLTLSPNNWYGVVYYNLKAFPSKEGTKYLLFGYDGYQFFEKRKVVDVLHFPDGKPMLGAPVFLEPGQAGEADKIRNRLVLEYSSDASVRLNYDENFRMITYDHLILAGGIYRGQGPVMVPDGSYCGYRLKKGMWEYQDKLFDQVQEEAPREYPVLDTRKGKNIFGKEK